MNAECIVRTAQETMEGAGAEVKRLFPVPGLRNADPFVLWDHFSVAPDTGFPDHPHRGFEAITYLFAGSMQHSDNLGNRSTITAGGAQRFTAGRGLIHSEMPGSAGNSEGIQLWINLPRRLKGIAPAYQQVEASEFPVQHFAGGWRKIIVGDGSPLKLLTPVSYAELQLDAGGHFEERPGEGYSGLIYVVTGEARIAGRTLTAGSACFVSAGRIAIEAGQDCRLMLCFGRAHGEPIHQHGPFVD